MEFGLHIKKEDATVNEVVIRCELMIGTCKEEARRENKRGEKDEAKGQGQRKRQERKEARKEGERATDKERDVKEQYSSAQRAEPD